MKRLVLNSIIMVLVTTLAAPAGAVFASQPPPLSFEEVALGEVPAENIQNAPTESSVAAQLASSEQRENPRPNQSLVPKNNGALPSRAAPEATPAREQQQAVQVNDTTAIPVTVPPVEEPALEPQRDVYVYAFQAAPSFGFVELYNSSTSVTRSINGWKMNVYFEDGSMCEVALQGYIFPETHVLLAQEGAVSGAQHAQTFQCDSQDLAVQKIEVFDGTQLVERLTPPHAPDSLLWVRKNTTRTYRTGGFSQDFKSDPNYSPVDGSWYVVPPAPKLAILEVLVQPRNCTPADVDPTCYDFVKIKNISDEPVDLSLYRLRTGFVNASSSASNTTYFSLVLQKGEVHTLTHGQNGERLSITANDGTVWFEDAEGVMVYPSDIPPYVGSGLRSRQGQSWARDEASQNWRWAIPSPMSIENQFPEQAPATDSSSSDTQKPCNADQFRNPETNRCKKIASSSTLTPCREGQYRNPETNRCRSSATLTSSLQPCNADQFRNPETNRCKKITSAAAGLQDCGPGRERNPLTNRCRNIAAATPPAADFAPEPIEEPASVFIGWAVMGGVALLALGYAGWEWREEIGQFLHRIPGVSRLMK